MLFSRRILTGSLIATAVIGSLAAPLIAATSRVDAGRKTGPDRTFELENEKLNIAADAKSSFGIARSYTAGSYFGYDGGFQADAPGPGVWMGATAYDYQKNGSMNHQVAVDEATGLVHFSWMHVPSIPDSMGSADRYVSYSQWDPALSDFRCMFNGNILSEPLRHGGFTTIDLLDDDGITQVAYHELETPSLRPYTPRVAWALLAGNCNHAATSLTNDAGHEWMWPRIAAADADDGAPGGEDSVGVDAFIHVVSADGSATSSAWDFGYHRGRRVGGVTAWSLPVVLAQGTTLSHVVCEDRISHDVAFVWCKRRDNGSPSQVDNDVAYLLSPYDGRDWVLGLNTDASDDIGGNEINITNYGVSSPHRAYTDLAALFDHQGDLHVVWNARYVENGAFFENQCDLLHWIDEVFRTGPATYRDAACPNPRADVAPRASCGDAVTDVLDVVFLIDHVFRSGSGPGDPCVCVP